MFMKNYFNKLNSYVIYLFPLVVLTGFTIAQGAALLSIIIAFFFLSKHEIKLIFQNKLIMFLALFCVYILFNTLLNSNTILQLSNLLYLRFLIFAVAIFIVLNFGLRINKNFINFFLLIIFSLIISGIVEFLLGYTIFKNGESVKHFGRISGFFGKEYILGSFLLKLLPIIFWYNLKNKFSFNNNVTFTAFFFGLYFLTIYLSGERTAFYLLIIFLIICFLFLNYLRKIIIYSSLISTVCVIIFSSFSLGIHDPNNRIFIKTFNQISNQQFTNKGFDFKKENFEILFKNLKIFSSAHQGHIELALYLFKQNPMFGVGPEGFRVYCAKVKQEANVGQCSIHPHNFFFQILSELGVVGIIFYLVIAGFFLKQFLSIINSKTKYKNDDKDLFLLANLMILVHLFPILPSGNFFSNSTSLLLYFSIGIYLYSYKKIFK